MSTNHSKESLNFEATLIGQKQPDFEATIVGDDSPYQELEKTSLPNNSILNEAQATTVVTLVNKFLAKAVEKKATDIHIEPEANFLSIRYRHGDSLKPLIDPLPKKLGPAILSRLKLMAELDINQSQTPQKGRIRKRGGGRTIHFCVQTQPSVYGEKMFIRVVDSAVKPPSLGELIPDTIMRQSLEEMIKGSSGLLLVSSIEKKAPVSLLYSLLCGEDLNPKKMATVEESITYLFPEMSQMEVDVDGDKDYSDVLQSLLEKDKGRILVDRLCDPSVARIVAEIAHNNRFVVTSITAEDGVSAMTLLSEMVTPGLLADTLIGVIHQHNLPRLCPACRMLHEPSVKELLNLGISQTKNGEITFYQPRSLNETQKEQMRQKGRLCRQCNGEGYDGESELYELLQITPSLKKAIALGTDLGQLKQIAFEEQKTSLMTRGLELVKQGEISLAQLTKLCPDLLEESIPPQTTLNLPPEITQRLEKVEGLLMTLTQEFNQLKQALQPTECVSTPEINIHRQSFDELFELSQISQGFSPEIDLCRETITADSSLYEELQDPGDWEALKRELDPNKETIIAYFSSEEENPNNSFKSIPDPWS